MIKYEDLITKKKSVILKIFKFFETLGFKSEIDMIKLNKAIKTTDFDNMKTKEEKETFQEALIDDKTGKRKIILNETDIAKVDKWTTAQHETLHAVLSEVLKNLSLFPF